MNFRTNLGYSNGRHGLSEFRLNDLICEHGIGAPMAATADYVTHISRCKLRSTASTSPFYNRRASFLFRAHFIDVCSCTCLGLESCFCYSCWFSARHATDGIVVVLQTKKKYWAIYIVEHIKARAMIASICLWSVSISTARNPESIINAIHWLSIVRHPTRMSLRRSLIHIYSDWFWFAHRLSVSIQPLFSFFNDQWYDRLCVVFVLDAICHVCVCTCVLLISFLTNNFFQTNIDRRSLNIQILWHQGTVHAYAAARIHKWNCIY